MNCFNPLTVRYLMWGFILFYDIYRGCGLRPQYIICSLWLLKIISWPYWPARYHVPAQRLKTLKLSHIWRVNMYKVFIQSNKYYTIERTENSRWLYIGFWTGHIYYVCNPQSRLYTSPDLESYSLWAPHMGLSNNIGINKVCRFMSVRQKQ